MQILNDARVDEEGDNFRVRSWKSGLQRTRSGIQFSNYAVLCLVASCVRLFATPQTVAYQAPPSMGFSRQEYWSGLPFPSPGDLLYPGIKPGSPAFQADALTSEPPGKLALMPELG